MTNGALSVTSKVCGSTTRSPRMVGAVGCSVETSSYPSIFSMNDWAWAALGPAATQFHAST